MALFSEMMDETGKLRDELARTKGAFLKYLQMENECARRGRLCGPSDTCGCQLEMEDYIDDYPAPGQAT